MREPDTAVTTRRVALYARVSTDDQAERGTIGAQRQFLRKLADLHQLDVHDEYVDEGISGTVPLAKRPAGARMLDDAAHGRFTEVIVYCLDRLGRSLSALLDAHGCLERAGATVRSATEPFDTGTPIGRFLFQLLGSLAELEKSTISERMSLGRDRVAREGKWTNGPVPFGYDLDEHGRLRPSDRRVAHQGLSEADIARVVFQAIAGGSSTVAEARRLNSWGLPTARRYAGGKTVTVGSSWLPSRINNMIRNRVYAGMHVFNSRSGPIERSVPALVDAETWARANAQLAKNRALPRAGSRRPYLLRGLITCGTCGRHYVGSTNSNATGWRGHYYRCGGQLGSAKPEAAGRCRAKSLPTEWIEHQVWSDCRAFISNPGPSLLEAREQLVARRPDTESLASRQEGLERALASKGAERERAMTLFRRGFASLEHVEAQLRAIDAEEAELGLERDAIASELALLSANEEYFAQADALLATLRQHLHEIDDAADWDRRRELVELLVSGIEVHTTDNRRREATVTVSYAFDRKHAVDATTGRRGHNHDTGSATS